MKVSDWKQLRKDYWVFWQDQDKRFKKSGDRNPFIDISEIQFKSLTADEKAKLSDILGKNNNLYRVSQILERSRKIVNKQVTLKEAREKLSYKPVGMIPLRESESLRDLSYSIPAINHHRVTLDELAWLYRNGYIPHLYWNNGKPRFNDRMWFIVDFLLRESREKLGLGFANNFDNYKPRYYVLKQYLDLTVYMYNSWNLGKTILDYSDKKAREKAKEKGLRGGEFRNVLSELTHDLWVNEGRALAINLIKSSPFAKYPDLLEYYRDVFALLAFEAFPGSYLIDIYHNFTQKAATFNFEQYMLVDTYNFGFTNINTYHSLFISRKYNLLFSAIDWALSMKDGVNNRGVSSVVMKYRRNKIGTNCCVCGIEFKPKKKNQKTCGKRECILENKNISKRKDKHLFPPIVPR